MPSTSPVDVPRVSISNDRGETVGSGSDSRYSTDPGEREEDETENENDNDDFIAAYSRRPPLLPPLQPSGESLSESLQAYSPAPGKSRPKSLMRPPFNPDRRASVASTRSRRSVLSQLRAARDKSDTASTLTVDEITAVVEQRRASTIVLDESEEDEQDQSGGAALDRRQSRPMSVRVPRLSSELPVSGSDAEAEDEADDDEDDDDDEEEGSSGEYDDEDDDDESDESEDVDDEDEDEEVVDVNGDIDPDHGKAFTSTGCESCSRRI